jgi:UDP-glucose 4-epimerase
MGKRIFVTGATGFVGGHVVRHLQTRGYDVVSCGRPGYGKIVGQVDAVVHAAGIAHRIAKDIEYEALNHSTAELICQSRKAGCSQFVFVSSIAAQSDALPNRIPLTEECSPTPVSPYGKAKLAVEELVIRSGIPFTVLRPVAITGEGAKGNTGLLQRLATFPVPVPLGSIHAKRSVVSIEGVVSAVETVLFNPTAIGQTYIVADLEPKSAADIIAECRIKAGRTPNIVKFPPQLLKGAFHLAGRGDMWDRIDGELIADPSRLMSIGWRPAGKREAS